MQAKFTILADTITPGTGRLLAGVSDRRPFLEAMARQLISIIKRSFDQPDLRISPWAPTKTGRPPLRRSGAMWESPAISMLTNSLVTVSTDRGYASYHQFGTKGPYVIRPKAKRALYWKGAAHPVRQVTHPGLPARPFFPFTPGGEMAGFAQERIRAVMEDKLKQIAPPS